MLNQVNNTHNECHACDFGGWDLKWLKFFIVGHQEHLLIGIAFAYAFDKYSLLAGGYDVAFVPLYEATFVDDTASNHIAIHKFRVHALAGYLYHKIDLSFFESRDHIIIFDIMFSY